MSTPKITEKELAEKLAGIYGDIDDYDWPTVARRAAEELGVELADEQPEPGTWHIVTDGPNAGKVARANEFGGLALYGDEGQVWTYTDCDSWPTLTPARVVPAEPMEDARSRAVDIIEEVVKNHIRVRLNIADTGGENAHSGTINQIRHLHLAEPHLPAVEAANRLRDAGVLSDRG